MADDPKGEKALLAWLEVKDDLLAGRAPRRNREGLTIRDLCNRFLTSRKRLVDSEEVTPRTFQEQHAACAQIVGAFGPGRLVEDLRPEDFEALRASMAKRLGPFALRVEMGRIKTVFGYAAGNHLVAGPIWYGQGFQKPSRAVLRKARAERGPRMLTREQLLAVLAVAKPHEKAMILLALNCGFGNSDIARLPIAALDLEAGWVSFPRPKTGIPRRVPLWPETKGALILALVHRPQPRCDAAKPLVFVTWRGRPWIQYNGKSWMDAVSIAFGNLLTKAGIVRKGRGSFYILRHVFRTVADGSRDQPAIDAIMGHVRDDMASVYREGIDDSRLVAVTDHVRIWLFGTQEAK